MHNSGRMLSKLLTIDGSCARKPSKTYLFRRRIDIAVRTKIELNPALCRRISGLDDIAKILFPDNRNHQRASVAIWVEIKHAKDQFLSSSFDLTKPHQITQRTVEIVRAKMKTLGLIKRISHFNPHYGSQSGWIFSDRFQRCLSDFSTALRNAKSTSGRKVDEQKDRDSVLYL